MQINFMLQCMQARYLTNVVFVNFYVQFRLPPLFYEYRGLPDLLNCANNVISAYTFI